MKIKLLRSRAAVSFFVQVAAITWMWFRQYASPKLKEKLRITCFLKAYSIVIYQIQIDRIK